MADEVKVIHIGHPLLFLHLFQVNAALAEQVSNGFLFLFGTPLPDKVVQRSVFAQNVFFGVVHDAFLA